MSLRRGDLQVFDVCRSYPTTGTDPVFCGSWIRTACEQRNIPFHQTQLGKLARAGLLELDNSSRGGDRRYYRLAGRHQPR
jgi:hypothetical protein